MQGSTGGKIKRGLQNEVATRNEVWQYWRDEDVQLKWSHYGMDVAQEMAEKIVEEMADTGELEIDPSYADYCYGSWFAVAAVNSAIEPILEDWSESHSSSITDSLYTGIGVVEPSEDVVYAVQIFCNYNFVESLYLEDTDNGIRSEILTFVQDSRPEDLNQIENSIPFEMLAQEWAVDAANGNNIATHDVYSRKCYGSGGEVVVSGPNSEIVLDTHNAIENYVYDGNILYTGVGVAVRNDGAVFVIQLFCSLQYQHQARSQNDQKLTKTESIINFVVNKEDKFRDKHSNAEPLIRKGDPRSAQVLADILAGGGTSTEDLNGSSDCGFHYFQFIVTGESGPDIWQNMFEQNDKIEQLKNEKYRSVRSGIAKDGDSYVLVQNFCFWI